MKATDWLEFVSWAKKFNYEIKDLKFNRDGTCSTVVDKRGLYSGRFFIVTDEMREIARELGRVHIIYISNFDRNYDIAREEASYSLGLTSVAPLRVLRALRDCKDIFKRDYGVDLEEYEYWCISGVGAIYDLKNDTLKTRPSYYLDVAKTVSFV